MPGDTIASDSSDSDAVTVGKRNVQQTVNMERQRDETDRYLADSNIKLEIQLGRLVDKMDRIVERLNDIERRLISIESSSHRDGSGTTPTTITDRLLIAILSIAMLVMLAFNLWGTR